MSARASAGMCTCLSVMCAVQPTGTCIQRPIRFRNHAATSKHRCFAISLVNPVSNGQPVHRVAMVATALVFTADKVRDIRMRSDDGVASSQGILTAAKEYYCLTPALVTRVYLL